MKSSIDRLFPGTSFELDFSTSHSPHTLVLSEKELDRLLNTSERTSLEQLVADLTESSTRIPDSLVRRFVLDKTLFGVDLYQPHFNFLCHSKR